MLMYKKYDDEIKRLYQAMRAEQDANDSIEDGDEWDAADQATALRFMPMIAALEHTREAIASASQPRNKWFEGFCKSLRQGQTLTAAQMDCFARYAKIDQYTRYKTPVLTYRAIVDGALYTATSGMKKVRIEQLTLLK